MAIEGLYEPELRYQPPTLTNPKIINVPASGGITYTLGPTEDAKIILPSDRPVSNFLKISGGDDIQIIGGQINGKLTLQGQFGSAYVEGVKIDMASAPGIDGILLNPEKGGAPDYYLQNVRILNVDGSYEPVRHGDIIQVVDQLGPVGSMYFHNVYGTGNWQGLALRECGEFENGPAYLSQVRFDCSGDLSMDGYYGSNLYYFYSTQSDEKPGVPPEPHQHYHEVHLLDDVVVGSYPGSTDPEYTVYRLVDPDMKPWRYAVWGPDIEVDAAARTVDFPDITGIFGVVHFELDKAGAQHPIPAAAYAATAGIGYVSPGYGGGGNVAPVANNNSAATTPGTAVEVAVLGNDTDANGDVLSIASFTQPANGTVVKDDQGTPSTADDALVYTPNSGFTMGTDTFRYTVSDGSLTDDATVTVTVGTAPPANTVSGTPGNDPLNGTGGDDSLLGLAGNDSIYGLDGNDTCVAGPGFDFFYGGPGADVCLFSPGEGADKWWDYQDGSDKIALPAGLNYGDLTFRTDTTWNYLWVQSGGADVLGLKYTSRSQIDASDFVGGTTPPPPSNVAPVANNNSAATTPGTAVEVAVLGNDTDANGDVLSIASFTQPANGTVVKDDQGTPSTADDALVYTPNSGFTSGTDTFRYTASDGSLSDDATVTVTVRTAPPANTVTGTTGNNALNGTSGNDSLLGLAGDDTISGLDGNDTCVAGPGLDFFTGGAGADVCLFSPGEGKDKWLDFQDGSDKIGLPAGVNYSQLTFRADTTWKYLWVQSGGVDVLGLKNISRSQIDASDFVGATNPPPPSNVGPVANDDSGATTPGTAVEVAVLGNDTDANGDVLSIASFTQPANGSVVKDDQGTASTADDALVYTPNSGFTSGSDTFRYTVSDGSLTDDATVTVTVGTAPPANTVSGTPGNDPLNGTGGDDSLLGLAGNDSIRGGAGNDTCVAGPGLDFFYGEGGADVCRFSPGEGADKWWDYQDGSDKIGLPAGLNYGDLTFRTDTTWNYLWVQSGGADVLGLKYTSRSQIDASDFILL